MSGNEKLLLLLKPLGPSVGSWEEANKELAELKDYTKDNWDGQDSAAVRLELVETTKHLLEHMRSQNMAAPISVYPLCCGTVMLEWHFRNKNVLSIEVRQKNYLECLLYRGINDYEWEVIQWE